VKFSKVLSAQKEAQEAVAASKNVGEGVAEGSSLWGRAITSLS